MKKLINRIESFRGEEGQGIAEYALIIGIVIVIAAVAVLAFGQNIADLFGVANTALESGLV